MNSPGKCEICQVAAHGTHFGVVSCRACAAFFRRSIVKNRQKQYLCRKDNQKCVIRPDDRFHCRLCRFNKCISLGMTDDNVQLYRDTLPSTRKKAHHSEPKPISFKTRNHPLKINSKRIVDVSEIRSEICTVLCENAEFTKPIFQKMNKLEQVGYGLRKWRAQQKPEKSMKTLKSVTIIDLFKVFHEQMIVMARWISHSADFQKLDTDLKYQFFKLVWNIWRRFERYEMSLELFGEKAVTEDKFALTDEYMVSADLQLDFSQVSSETNEKLRKCFRDPWKKEFQKIAKPLLELKPTSTEMTFMLSELCWQIAGKTMQGKVLEISEEARDELSTNLHNYYQKNEKQQNYASRLIKLMKVVSSVIKSHGELKKTMELAHIFNVFNVELSEPDLFDG